MMNEPWFNPALYSWIPGTVYGTALGVLGGLTGTLASLGKGRTFCLGAWGLAFVVAGVFLVVSLTAYFSGQPYGIWYGFGLPALLGLILCPVLLPTVRRRFQEAEERRMQATDFPLD